MVVPQVVEPIASVFAFAVFTVMVAPHVTDVAPEQRSFAGAGTGHPKLNVAEYVPVPSGSNKI